MAVSTLAAGVGCRIFTAYVHGERRALRLRASLSTLVLAVKITTTS